MNSRLLLTNVLFATLLACASQLSHAQVSTHITYEEHIKRSRSFQQLDENLFGDKVSLQDGALSFTYDDVVLPTNSQLRVSIGRKSTADLRTRNTPEFHVFGSQWDLEIPYMMATYDTRDGWNAGDNVVGNGWGEPLPNYNRCTSGHVRPRERLGPWPYYNAQPIYAHMYWKGIQINIPGQGNEQLLKLNSSQPLPVNGNTYYGTTRSGWKISCLSSLKKGVGEGFKVTTTDGITYHFDWMVTRNAVDLTDNNSVDAQGDGYDPWHLLAPLTDVYLYATKAEDRFGNSLIYTYDNTHPQRIKSIESNDGVRLDVNYDVGGKIATVVSGARVWTYAYNGYELQSLQLPDASKWTFTGSFSSFSGSPETLGFWSNACEMNPGNMSAYSSPDPSMLNTVSVTHPSGARGEFTYRSIYHGINNAPGGCGIFGSVETGYYYGTWGVPSAYGVVSLHSKKISGPGMADRVWSYSYTPNWSFQSQCGSGCDSSVTTSVSTSDGVIRRYVFGNDYSANYGQLLSERVEKNGVTYKKIDHSYVLSAQGHPFPDNTGDIAVASGLPDLYGNPFRFKNRPRLTTVIQTDQISQVFATSYTKSVQSFDLFARPTSVAKQSSLGYGKSEVVEYHDNLSSWVLGQIKKTIVNGTVASETEYSAQALPIWTKKFGKLQQTLTYNTDGTLATVADGRGNVTTLSNWKRGIPQLIRHPATPEAPAGATESATVNDNGWITSVTDENGYATGYGYDPMGRLASIVQATGDSVTYHNTLMNFRALTDTDWKPSGVVSGQWRLYEETGSRATITYMDALWRPVLKHEYDATNVGPTLRAVKTGYDTSGRVSFQSYPSSDMIPGASGIRTFYDALDRVTRVEQDSELGVLATTTEYLSGLKTRVTNPRGFQTTTSFMAWDQPGYDLPILSEQPEGKVIEIARHPQFGWPQQLKQRNTAGTLQQSRQYVYDTYGQLCKTIEPETGATVMDYDAAGNLSWSAAGLIGATYTGLNDCSQAAAGGSGRVTHRAYDARNRQTNLAFPNGRGNQVWSYTPDGLPASITTYNESGTATPVVNGYSYNRRRLMTGESIYQAGWYNWATGYGYDAYGHLSLQTYHTGLNVDYAPNVYGQPTKAGTFASGAQYYPNGALKQFTYGNGIVHTMTQNARQLPVRVTATGNAMDYDYAYDPNGNVERIYDYVTGTPTPRHRWMGYDGLDRLTSTASAVFGGTDNTHRFTYDALDNMTSWKLAGVKDYADYVYDASTHRLTNIRNTAGATVVGMDYDEQGNLRNKNGQAYEFDYGNRLRNVPGKESYRYDGHGRRVLNLRPDGSNILSMYGFNGQVVLQDHGTKVEEHIYLAGSIVATRVKTWATGGTYSTRYQHTDALGSPVAVSDEAGQVIERNDFEPYGAIIGKPTFSGIGYTGHVMDGATGLTYMQQRYYDESVGRFLSVDPVDADTKTGANFNRYKYGNDNPYRFIDPDGRLDRERKDAERERKQAQSRGRHTITRYEPQSTSGNATAPKKEESSFVSKITPKDPVAAAFGVGDVIFGAPKAAGGAMGLILGAASPIDGPVVDTAGGIRLAEGAAQIYDGYTGIQTAFDGKPRLSAYGELGATFFGAHGAQAGETFDMFMTFSGGLRGLRKIESGQFDPGDMFDAADGAVHNPTEIVE